MVSILPKLLRVALALFAAAILIPAAQAVTLKPGDIIVVDANSFGGRGGVIKVDPITGVQEVISSAGDLTGGLFSVPRGCAIDAAGQIIVADDNALGGGGLIRVDPTTGSQTAISSGGFFVDPKAVTLDVAGNIIVADAGPSLNSGSVIKVNPTTGAQTLISSGGFFVDPLGVAIDAVGDIVVSPNTTLMVGILAPS